MEKSAYALEHGTGVTLSIAALNPRADFLLSRFSRTIGPLGAPFFGCGPRSIITTPFPFSIAELQTIFADSEVEGTDDPILSSDFFIDRRVVSLRLNEHDMDANDSPRRHSNKLLPNACKELSIAGLLAARPTRSDLELSPRGVHLLQHLHANAYLGE
ncbi:hypothetical protein GQX74_005939 [Glossina fuscipes]|nr:hypothetical protein GQX74_005939 [Glossina fuscipes]